MTLVTFGETMLRLGVSRGERLETTDEFAVHVGGAESNVACAAATLGREAVWCSRLPDGPLGRRITRALAAQGVETRVAWADDGRVGTYYYEPGGTPRGARVVYDRANAAVTRATPADVPTDELRAADEFYVSGITPALSDTLQETTRELVATAREADTRVAFDVNYREKLWSPETARETLDPYLDAVDTLVIAERDARRVFDATGDPREILRRFADRDAETIVLTRGADGALAHHDGTIHEGPVFEADTHDPVGTGDAFVGGFLTWRHDGASVEQALRAGAATAACKRTLVGDNVVVTRAEVERVMREGDDGISR